MVRWKAIESDGDWQIELEKVNFEKWGNGIGGERDTEKRVKMQQEKKTKRKREMAIQVQGGCD